MSDIIVLGDGMLGSEIVKQTGWHSVSRKKNNIDFTSPGSYTHLLKGYKTVINCIAYTNTYSDDRTKHWDVNYKAVADLVLFCNLNQIKVIHISTDHIYANSPTNASEDTVPQHLGTWYGYTKLLGDAHVQMAAHNYLVIRESHKPYPFPYKQAWYNQITNGDYVNVIASLIIKLVNNGASGVYNVGTEGKTWYSLTREEFNTTPSLTPTGAPNDITMDLTKLNNEIKGINQ
jgi:dTDP-4-dehydrorhamnose reductase